MRVAHLADTHLGCIGTGWQRSVADPFNQAISIRQQEADIRLAFARTIDRIISLKPDVVIHAGDVFDHAHPTPHALQFAFGQLRRLSAQGIPVILIEGDHSSPRMPAQGEPLQILGNIPGVQVVCGSRIQIIELSGAAVYAVPYRALLVEDELNRLSEMAASKSKDPRILAAHGVADGLPFYQTYRSAATIPVKQLAPRFDYVALGHCHRFCQVAGTDRAFYSGSAAMALTNDFRPGRTFGFNMADVRQGLAPEVEREVVDTRPMCEYGLSDASGRTAEDIMLCLRNQLEASPPSDAYCRVVIADIDPQVRSQIVFRDIERLFPLAEIAGLSVQAHTRAITPLDGAARTGKTPRERFHDRLEHEAVSDAMRGDIGVLGNEMFDSADAQLRSEDQDEA